MLILFLQKYGLTKQLYQHKGIFFGKNFLMNTEAGKRIYEEARLMPKVLMTDLKSKDFRLPTI